MSTGYKEYNNYSQRDKDSMRTLAADTSNANETTIIGQTDELEGLIKATNSKLDDIKAYTDGIEAKLDDIKTYTDGAEAKLDTLANKLDTLAGYVDGIEGKLDTLAGYVDGIEGKLDTVNTSVGNADTHIVAAIQALPHDPEP